MRALIISVVIISMIILMVGSVQGYQDSYEGGDEDIEKGQFLPFTLLFLMLWIIGIMIIIWIVYFSGKKNRLSEMETNPLTSASLVVNYSRVLETHEMSPEERIREDLYSQAWEDGPDEEDGPYMMEYYPPGDKRVGWFK